MSKKTAEEINFAIRKHLTEDAFYADSMPKNFDLNFQLMESGALDSIGVFNLIVFLEREFNIKIGLEDLSAEYFGTLARLANFVEHKLSVK